MNGNMRLIGTLAMVLLVATVQMAGAESQDWRLLGEDHEYGGNKSVDGTTHHKDLFMNKTGDAKSYMRLPNMTKKTTWWYAESPAQFDGLTFGEGEWTVEIDHSKKSGYTIFANVCKVNGSGKVTYLANGSESASSLGTTTITCTDVDDTDQVFNTTDRLALRIYHNKTGTDLWIYYYNATSYHSCLTSPSTDPDYPVPELPTIILTATGVLMLAGCASLRRSGKADK